MDLDGIPLRRLFFDSFRNAVCGKLHSGQFLIVEFCKVGSPSILGCLDNTHTHTFCDERWILRFFHVRVTDSASIFGCLLIVVKMKVHVFLVLISLISAPPLGTQGIVILFLVLSAPNHNLAGLSLLKRSV